MKLGRLFGRLEGVVVFGKDYGMMILIHFNELFSIIFIQNVIKIGDIDLYFCIYFWNKINLK